MKYIIDSETQRVVALSLSDLEREITSLKNLLQGGNTITSGTLEDASYRIDHAINDLHHIKLFLARVPDNNDIKWVETRLAWIEGQARSNPSDIERVVNYREKTISSLRNQLAALEERDNHERKSTDADTGT